jgi:hypothetical protein
MSLWDVLTVAQAISALAAAIGAERAMGGGLIRAILGILSGVLVGTSSVAAMFNLPRRGARLNVKVPSERVLRMMYAGAILWFFLAPAVSVAITRGLVRIVLGSQAQVKKVGSVN